MEVLKRANSSTYRKRQDSARNLSGSNTEKTLLQEASVEAVTLSLDPKAAKKRKNIPRQLPKINTNPEQKAKNMKGNYAAKVLEELERKEENKKFQSGFKEIDREIKQVMRFDPTDLLDQMNDAFEGTETVKSTKNKTTKEKKKKDMSGLEPILEEKND